MIGKKGLVLALVVAVFGFAGTAWSADPNTYPPNADTEYEQSIITIPLYAGGAEPVEILKLTAFMRLERETPKRNGLGHRQLEFTIADWELYGYSQYLESDVTFKLSDIPVQPKSLVISLTESADYPAMIVYNAIYDIYIGQKLVAKNRPGVAFAKNVYEIPPRNISVAFSKPFSMARPPSKKQANLNAAATDLIFDSGTCEDMVQISKAEFDVGLTTSKAIRAGQLSLAPTTAR